MSLTAGTRLGPYEILAKLGEGGMGEVYRARDTRLGRDVAIKVLPSAVAGDPERRGRFEREAQTIAALNHPNIVTIHGVEPAGEALCLVMELVEGTTLGDLIPRGGLRLDRLLKIALPVVDAVVAAHQKGITHRDLKPANIMIGSGEQDGRVKVLDFGLAKLTPAPGGGESGTLTLEPTATPMPAGLATGEGRILGTVAYMSPEQAEGKAIDARSDIFSLGIILYEMASGQRPFVGDTSISIISSIVKDAPKSVTELNPALPRDFARIVRRALAKDPEKRYQTAKDLRNDLEELKASLDSGELEARQAGGGSSPARQEGPWRLVAIGAIAIAMLTVGVATVMLRRASAPSAANATAATPITMVPLTSTGNTELGTLSADGKYVAYVQTDEGQQSVWLRQLASGSTVRILPAMAGLRIMGLTIAPDSSFVDVVRSRSAAEVFPADLWRVPFLGGQARKIVDEVTSAPGWSPDGRQMAYLVNVVNDRRVMVANADGSQARVLASRSIPLRYLTLSLAFHPDVRPMWQPDGRGLVVMGSDEVRLPGRNQLIRIDLATGAESVVADIPESRANQGGFGIGRDGVSVLWNHRDGPGPAQVVRREPNDGEARPITSDLATYAGVSLAGDALVSTREQVTSSVWIADAGGRSARQLGRDIPAGIGDLEWAGPSRLVFGAALAGGSGVWATNLSDGTMDLLVPGGSFPSASADGRKLAFIASVRELWRADGDGSHRARIPGATGMWPTLTPDGTKVFYVSSESGEQSGWVADVVTGAPRRFTDVRAGGVAPRVSPDGRQVFFGPFSAEQLHVMAVDTGGTGRTVKVPQGAMFRWMPDGRNVAYLDTTGENIWTQAIEGGAPRQLTTFADHKPIADFVWSPDGRQLAIVRSVGTSDIVLLKGVR